MATRNPIGSFEVFRALTTPIVTAICLAADIATKTWARSSLVGGATTELIPGILNLTLTTNTGAAFSLGSGNSMLMSSVACLMTVALIVWTVRRELRERNVPMFDRIGMGCLLGGAIGNVIDRFARGRVTDFLDFAFFSFPVFNVADILIDVGIGLLILGTLRRQDKNGNTNSFTPTNDANNPDASSETSAERT